MSTPDWVSRTIAATLARMRDEFALAASTWPILASDAGAFFLNQAGEPPFMPDDWRVHPRLAYNRPDEWVYNTTYGPVNRPDVFWLCLVRDIERHNAPSGVLARSSLFNRTVDIYIETANSPSTRYYCHTTHGEVVCMDLEFIFRRFGSEAIRIHDAMPGASAHALDALLNTMED